MQDSTRKLGMNARWISSWAASPQLTEPADLPPALLSRGSPELAGTTLRQTVRVTLGGQRIRLWLSNAHGSAALAVTEAWVALPRGGRTGVSAIEAGTSRPVTFGGQAAVVIPPGAQASSDPVDVGVPAGSSLTVTMYLERGQVPSGITGHPGSRTTSYIAAGSHARDEDLASAAAADHWYFLSGVDVWSGPAAAAVAIMGDSLTDGRGSTTNGNDRWPDQLFARLQSSRDTSAVAVLNLGIGGNRVLSDGLGPAALTRLARDVLGRSGIRWLVVFEGVNDIGTAAATRTGQQNAVSRLIEAYRWIIGKAEASGIMAAGATLTPFGGHETYDDLQGLREASRQAVNRWIRSGRAFGAVLDFDQAVRDPASPRQLMPRFDCGDHLHLSPAGYQALADAVPAGLFTLNQAPRRPHG